MKCFQKCLETGTVKAFDFPDNLPKNDLLQIKAFMERGGRAEKTFAISKAEKAYSPTDNDISLIATALNKEVAWVQENMYFVKMIASDTTIDSQFDKFSESVIKAMGVQYSGGWANGEVGGRGFCFMHSRTSVFGKTFKHEIQNAKDSEGNDILDENNSVVRQLVLYAYVNKKAIHAQSGLPYYELIETGLFTKVSISAYLRGWEYVSSADSNYIPKGQTNYYGYFYYPNGDLVETVEVSLVDLGANQNATITKSFEVTFEEAAPVQNENTETENKEIETPITQANKSVVIDTNEFENMQAVYESLPTMFKSKDNVVKWEEVTLLNYTDKSAFFAPDFCATKFRNLDKTLGNKLEKIAELKAEIASLKAELSSSNDKSVAIDLEKQDVQKEFATLKESNAKIEKEHSEMVELLRIERDFYTNKFVTISAQIDNNTTDSNAVNAYAVLASEMTLKALRERTELLYVELLTKSKTNSISVTQKQITQRVL
jgi:hypothetical protein